MSEFKNKSITTKGLELLSKAMAGGKLEFTRLEMGSGTFSGDILKAENLIEVKQNLSITNIVRKGGQVTLSAILKVEDITAEYDWTEIGVYAKGADEVEVLYMYGYTTSTSFISKDSLNEKLINVTVIVSNAANVTALIDGSIVYLTMEELEKHNTSDSAHNDIREQVKKLDDNKIDKTQIKNTLDETETGNVLDAVQGKILSERIDTLNNDRGYLTTNKLLKHDLNLLTSNGFYYINDPINTPIPNGQNNNGYCEVIFSNTTGYLTQTVTQTVTGTKWTRVCSQGIWLDWQQIATTDNISNPNLLINGDFQVWQRGESFTSVSNGQYTSDRWRYIGDDKQNSIQQDTSVTYMNATSLKVIIANNDGSNIIRQEVEDKSLLDKPLTLSYWIKGVQGSNFLTTISDNSVVTTCTGEWQKVILTTTIAKARGRIFVDIIRNCTKSGTYYLSCVKLELGSVATLFTPRSYAEELSMCQRYYHRNRWITIRSAVVGGNQLRTVAYNFPTQMRIAPTIKAIITQPINVLCTYDLSVNMSQPSNSIISPTSCIMYNNEMCDFQFTTSGLASKDYVLEIKDYAYEFDAEIY